MFDGFFAVYGTAAEGSGRFERPPALFLQSISRTTLTFSANSFTVKGFSMN